MTLSENHLRAPRADERAKLIVAREHQVEIQRFLQRTAVTFTSVEDAVLASAGSAILRTRSWTSRSTSSTTPPRQEPCSRWRSMSRRPSELTKRTLDWAMAERTRARGCVSFGRRQITSQEGS